jgi:hypothetical protein
MSDIRIGGDNAEYLLLSVKGRRHPMCSDYDDGNWLDCVAEIAAGDFRGRVSGVIRAEEIEQFQQDLSRLYEHLKGKAVFETLEGWINVCIAGDGRGHLEARGQLCDNLAAENTLDFCLHLDQSYLPTALGQMRATLAEYPVVGR